MELYLDSANLKEIEEAFKLGYLAGLTTTPTFMHRDGVADIDGLILKLAKMVPVLQVEALGNNADEIVREAERLVSIGLDPKKSVFKIPVSIEGTKACKRLIDKGYMVNVHLVYTIQQAYMAMSAGATYVCPLVGRLQDQGHDALCLVADCVEVVEKYGYDSKIMFSSVRYAEHIRNALNVGVHTCTIPWKVMQQLTSNHFTDLGTQQFVEHTRLMTVTVKEAMTLGNCTISKDKTIMDALVQMSLSKIGAIAIVDNSNTLLGVFTDGDLRRNLETKGESFISSKLSELQLNKPFSVEASQLLFDASNLLKEKSVDTLIVTENNKPVGLLDIHDLYE